MSVRITFLALAIAAAVAGTSVVTLAPQWASAESAITHGSLTIEQPWARATPKAAKVGAGYIRITNNGSADDRLVSAETDIAGVTELHTMSMTDGVMRMRRMENGLVIKAGETIELAPGGDHIMFMRLPAPITKDQKFKTRLLFEKAGPIEVTFSAVRIGGTPKGAKRGSHGAQPTRGSH
ncbi:MAG: copper chaperone PCu(A)C [Pseudomonadota bacterium]